MDLSWPEGASVNHGVQKNQYLQSYFMLKYPSIDHIIEELNTIGPGAKIFKVDISRAFRHLRIDPGDIDLLGLQHKGLYLDGTLAEEDLYYFDLKNGEGDASWARSLSVGRKARRSV